MLLRKAASICCVSARLSANSWFLTMSWSHSSRCAAGPSPVTTASSSLLDDDCGLLSSAGSH